LVRDLKSTNGTFVNGQVISELMRLNSQDVILVGATEIVFIDPEATQKGELPNFSIRRTPEGDIQIDDGAKTVQIKSVLLDPPLTVKEFQLLHLLHRGLPGGSPFVRLLARGRVEGGQGTFG
jgi:pSer/pThr/pTyr-binding forkhead associated (FHA) protein